jgi:hypothetical protein
MVWAATARAGGLPISGFDRLTHGQGMMQWKLLGLVSVMSASGPDITRSAAGRMMAEAVWLPSVMCRSGVAWTAPDSLHARARIAVAGETAELTLTVDADGALRQGRLPRWSNPDNTKFRFVDFGALVEAHRTFGGFTIPTRLRAGYYPGTPRFDSEGEFFRATVDDAAYR